MKPTLMFFKKIGFVIDNSDLKKYGRISFYRKEKKTRYPLGKLHFIYNSIRKKIFLKTEKQEIICNTLEDLISAVYICGLEDGKKEKSNEIYTAIKNL